MFLSSSHDSAPSRSEKSFWCTATFSPSTAPANEPIGAGTASANFQKYGSAFSGIRQLVESAGAEIEIVLSLAPVTCVDEAYGNGVWRVCCFPDVDHIAAEWIFVGIAKVLGLH